MDRRTWWAAVHGASKSWAGVQGPNNNNEVGRRWGIWKEAYAGAAAGAVWGLWPHAAASVGHVKMLGLTLNAAGGAGQNPGGLA